MALPNLSALVPPTGEGGILKGPNSAKGAKGNVVIDVTQPKDDDPACEFKVCLEKNSLPWDFPDKEVLFAEEVLVRYETPLPDDFKKEMLDNYSDDMDGALKTQWQTVPYLERAVRPPQYAGGPPEAFIKSRQEHTEYEHGITFRDLVAHQRVMSENNKIAVVYKEGEPLPSREELKLTLWMETVPETCKEPLTTRRICLIRMSAWAGRLAAMPPGDRKKHRKETLYDGYCQLLKAAFDLDDRGPTAGPKGKATWIEKATFAALLLEMYVPVLRDVVRAENPQKELTDIDAEKEVYKQARCSSAYDAKSGATKQASDIHRLIVRLKQQAQTLNKELQDYRQRKKDGTLRDEDDVPSREELMADWMADWNRRRNGIDYN